MKLQTSLTKMCCHRQVYISHIAATHALMLLYHFSLHHQRGVCRARAPFLFGIHVARGHCTAFHIHNACPCLHTRKYFSPKVCDLGKGSWSYNQHLTHKLPTGHPVEGPSLLCQTASSLVHALDNFVMSPISYIDPPPAPPPPPPPPQPPEAESSPPSISSPSRAPVLLSKSHPTARGHSLGPLRMWQHRAIFQSATCNRTPRPPRRNTTVSFTHAQVLPLKPCVHKGFGVADNPSCQSGLALAGHVTLRYV